MQAGAEIVFSFLYFLLIFSTNYQRVILWLFCVPTQTAGGGVE